MSVAVLGAVQPILAVNPVPWARSQMAFTLAFHIILVPLGVSWAFMALIANYRGIKHGDAEALQLAQRWSKYMAVTFAVGAVTGTVLTFEFGLLWPRFMGQWGEAFGVPFAFEGIFFFTEAIFVAIYIYGWRRMKPWPHFWTGVPLVVTGILGSVSVVAANAWMNSPSGFTLNSAGDIVDVDPWSVIFNDAMPLMAAHMVVAAYVVGGFLIASVYAFAMLRGRRDRYHRVAFLIAFSVGAVAIPIQMTVGDSLARWVYNNQPIKFAAIELVPETTSDVPEELFGHLNSDGTVSGGIPIPGLASILSDPATGTSTVIQGLDTVPADERPTTAEVNVVHLSWDIMVGLGTLLLLLSVWYGATWLFRRDMPKSRWFLRFASVAGVAAVVALEAGWVVSEVGRQPWIVYNLQKVEDAATGQHRRLDHLHRRGRALHRARGHHGADPAQAEPTVPGPDRGRARGAVWPERAGTPGAGARRGDGAMTDAVAVLLMVAIAAYAVFGGADFGAGFWDLVAGGAQRGERPRELIDHSIGPVWEANHVWLIFIFVILWTGFPEAYASITLTLFVPLTLAALGIVLRGSSFAFRKTVFRTRDRRNFGAAFASSSVLVPYCLGAVAGAVASGRVPAGGKAGDPWTSWVNPTSVLGGVLAVVVVAYLASVYLVWDARRLADQPMVEYFRLRAVGAAVVAGVVAFVGIFVLRADARYVFDGLTSRALPLVLLSAICGTASLVLLMRNADRGARILAMGAVASVVFGWGVAQWPYILPESLKVSQAAAPSGTLGALLVAAVGARDHRAPRLHPPLHPRPEEPAPGRGRRRLTAAGRRSLIGTRGFQRAPSTDRLRRGRSRSRWP